MPVLDEGRADHLARENQWVGNELKKLARK